MQVKLFEDKQEGADTFIKNQKQIMIIMIIMKVTLRDERVREIKNHLHCSLLELLYVP